MPKCDFFIEITFWYGCSPVNLLHIFGIPFPKNIFGRLLLDNFAEVACGFNTDFSNSSLWSQWESNPQHSPTLDYELVALTKSVFRTLS